MPFSACQFFCPKNDKKETYFNSSRFSLTMEFMSLEIECKKIYLPVNLRGRGLPLWLSGKESACQCRRHRVDPCSGKIPEFPSSSAGKESTCNAGNPCLIPGSGRSTGEGISYPLKYSWASQVAQLVKNLPTMQETWVRSLGWEDPLEKGLSTQSSILAWKIPWTI